MDPPRFAPGSRVQYQSDLSKVGTVQKNPLEAQGEWWYRVELAGGGTETVPESLLQPFLARQDPESLFIRGRFGGVEDLIRKVTFHKLNEPLQNTLYSLGASRTEFFPHQYKPLLKFIDSQDQRLLIADEVGLGKTIEAGLIMVELRARRQLQSALVVCPSALTGKWKEEMSRRFDEEFRVLTSSELRQLLTRFRDQGELSELRAIISLQSLRQTANRELLEALALPVDLVVVDEAHHLRNPETQSHRAVDALTVGALAVVFLTATPIHLGSENLFHLLRLLQPGEFDDVRSFSERLEANVPVVEAERLARQIPLRREEVLVRLRSLMNGRGADFFTGSAFLERSVAIVEQPGPLETGDQVELMANLKDLNLLSHIITRSRKRDVFEKTPVRSPRVVAPTPTEAELAFYRAVTDFVRDMHGGDDNRASLFAGITAQRQVASCMQAAKDHFRAMAVNATAGAEESDLDLDTWSDVDDEDAPLLISERLLLAADRLGEVDTKCDALLAQLDGLEEEEPGRKIIVFSYFKGTLRYLERRLTAHGIPCVRIDGDVKSNAEDREKDERGNLIRRFREDQDIRVLLSSEVGSEGLDFQFAHVLVNYDLPWNPMRVEQRIGRLDRIGQDSDKIIIVNLTLPGTIEHRILERLYERIGIFERSLGDLEAILGNEVEKLTRDLLSRRLTPAEEDARIEQTAMVLEERSRQLAELEKEGERLVGAGLYFDEQLERARSGGETLAARDLEVFLTEFLRRRFPDSELRKDGKDHALLVSRPLEDALRALQDGRPMWLRLLRRINNDGPEIPVTFESSRAFQNADLEFLAPHHPLFRLAVAHYEDRNEELHPVAAVRVSDVEGVQSGLFAFAIHQVTVALGSGPERYRLHPVFLSSENGEALDGHRSSLLLGAMLRRGTRMEMAHEAWEEGVAGRLIERLDELATERIAQERKALLERQAGRVRARLVSLESSFGHRRAQKMILLTAATLAKKDPRYLRMLQGTIRNLEANYEARRADLEKEREATMWGTLIAAGLVEVSA